MDSKQNDPQIEMLHNDLKKLIKNGGKKDGWDKLSIISSLISSILVVTIGSLFTYYYQSKQDEKQLQVQIHQTKLQELDCVGKLMPYLTSDDDRIKKVSFLTLNKLASTEIAAELAILNLSAGSESAIKEIAHSKSSVSAEKNIAEKTLQKITQIKQSSFPEIQKIEKVPAEDGGGYEIDISWSKLAGEVDGYRLYYGTTPGMPVNMIDVGNSTNYTLFLPEKGAYYISVRAYFDSLESMPSNEIMYALD